VSKYPGFNVLFISEGTFWKKCTKKDYLKKVFTKSKVLRKNGFCSNCFLMHFYDICHISLQDQNTWNTFPVSE
jgi:hypothetical protein